MDAVTVLIIDDDPLTCKLITTMLKLQGYTSTSLTDPNLIWNVLKTKKPAMILMDYHLGASHGLEVLHALKTNNQSKSIPIVMASGMDYRKEALDAGAEDFLVKPFDWQELIGLINRVAKGS